MESIRARLTSDILLVRFDPGELLLEGLRDAIKAEGIQTGIVVSGIGTLSECRIHHTVAGYPPSLLDRRVEHSELKGSYEIAAIQGIIVEGEPHLHVTLSDAHSSIAGHLEDGCRVMTLAELAIVRSAGGPLRRVVRGPERIRQLTAE